MQRNPNKSFIVPRLKYSCIGRELELRLDGKRKYGETSYVRLPSSRATTFPNTKVAARSLRARALAAKDFISLNQWILRLASR